MYFIENFHWDQLNKENNIFIKMLNDLANAYSSSQQSTTVKTNTVQTESMSILEKKSLNKKKVGLMPTKSANKQRNKTNIKSPEELANIEQQRQQRIKDAINSFVDNITYKSFEDLYNLYAKGQVKLDGEDKLSPSIIELLSKTKGIRKEVETETKNNSNNKIYSNKNVNEIRDENQKKGNKDDKQRGKCGCYII